MNLENVHSGINKHKRKRRVGRGPGSGRGKTASRGHKGQKSRSGWSRKAVFQGGAMPLVRRVPKRGFNNKFGVTVAAINIGDLNEAFQAGDEVNPDILRERSLVKGVYDELKILGDGELSIKLKVVAHRFSKSAEAAIKEAGGEVEVLPGKKPVVKNKQKSAGQAKPAAAKPAPEPAKAKEEAPQAEAETPADDTASEE